MKTSFAAVIVMLFALIAKGDMCTLSISTGVTNYIVPTNVTAQVVHAPNGTTIQVTIGTNSVNYSSSGTTTTGLPIVVGPAKISVGGSAGSYCTIQVTAPSQFIPSSAVVIPNDAGGPVTIVMESSTDLINWTAALPGTYGTTSSNRFFRVRAQR